MKILFIHGMNQQHYTAYSLFRYWMQIFKQGLQNFECHVHMRDFGVNMPFYGDLMTDRQLKNGLQISGLFGNRDTNEHEIFFKQPKKQNLIQRYTFIPKLETNLQQQQSFSQYIDHLGQKIRNKMLLEFSRLLNDFPNLHQSLIQKYLAETYLYLSDEEFTAKVNQRILKNLSKDEEYIVVAHSLGTIIAYHLFGHTEHHIRMKRFITLGSPLAFKVMQERLSKPIQRPACLTGDWYNFYSPEDFVTAFPLKDEPFNFNPPIINQSVHTLATNPHDIAGYLQQSSVIRCMIEPYLETKLKHKMQCFNSKV